MLEHDVWIGFQVAHVDLVSKLLHVGMLLAQQPAHMGEEKAASRVVRICVCVAEFVMNAKCQK